MMKRESDINRSDVFFLLISIVAGLAAAYYSSGNMIAGYIESRDWVEVPATIHDISLVTKGGGSSFSSVKSNYSYYFKGDNYQGERVSLSSGKAVESSYWEELDRALRASQNSDEASVFVNPANPAQSVLYRTLSRNILLIGLFFLIFFSGVGCFKFWRLKNRSKRSKRDLRIDYDDGEGIASDEKSGGWRDLVFGGVFFVIGVVASSLSLPDAIREKDYVVLFVLLFVVIGAGFIYYGIKQIKTYRLFGPTPLLLDPALPGIGGRLGGRFSIDLKDFSLTAGSDTYLQGMLTCSRKIRSRKKVQSNVMWAAEVPVFIEQTATGLGATFLFEIPTNCMPSTDWIRSSCIEWRVSVEGELNNRDLPRFERSWKVIVDERATQVSRVSTVSQGFIENEIKNSEVRAKTSILEQVPLTEDAQFIKVQSLAGRDVGIKLLGMLLGAFFAAMGVYVIQTNGFIGPLLALAGTYVAFNFVNAMAKSINVKIDKHSRVLSTQESWFGFVFARHQSEIVTPDQFQIRKFSGSRTATKVTEIFVVEFISTEKTIRIADGIEGKEEALALISTIVDRCFK